MNRATLIKLCGIQSALDGRHAVEAGADLVGIVLVPDAGRCVTLATAREIATAVRAAAAERGGKSPRIVGVIGDIDVGDLQELLEDATIDMVQLVAGERRSRELADALEGVDVIRTIHVGSGDDLHSIEQVAQLWERRGARVVFDSSVAGARGGTGTRVDEALLSRLRMRGTRGIAGGLDSLNVAAVIRGLEPYLVDVSSGIELAPGSKDPQLMKAFVAAARGEAPAVAR